MKHCNTDTKEMSDEDTLDDDIRTRISEETGRELDELAIERSEPDNRVTRSDLVRDAIDEYLQRYRTEE